MCAITIDPTYSCGFDEKICVGEYEFIGMNQILDHPFGCKDRVVTETDYIPQRQLRFFAGISNEYGYDRIVNIYEQKNTRANC